MEAQVLPIKDSGDNYFFSVNIVVGREDEDAVIGVIYSRTKEQRRPLGPKSSKDPILRPNAQ